MHAWCQKSGSSENVLYVEALLVSLIIIGVNAYVTWHTSISLSYSLPASTLAIILLFGVLVPLEEKYYDLSA